MKLAFAIAALALSLSNATASTTIAFDSLGPSDSFDTSVGWVIGGGAYRGQPDDFNNLPAALFTSLESGVVTQLSTAIRHFGEPLAPVLFQIRADNAGLPGLVLGQASVSASTSLEVRSVSFESAGVTLAAGVNYWFSIEATDQRTDASWALNVLGINGPMAIFNSPLTSPGSNLWGQYPSITLPAFRVELAPVPEPATALLLLAGLSIFAVLGQSSRR